MPPLTLEKMLLIAIVIGLGAAIIANVPANSGPTFQRSAIDGPTVKGIGNSWNKGSTESDTGRRFLEQTPFPYVAIDGPLHRASGLEFEV